jgi:hypothetical protein
MNFLNDINYKKDEKIKHNDSKEHNINEKEETLFDLYMLVIGYIIIISFGVFFHSYFYTTIPSEIFKLSIFTTIVFPLVLFSYYIFYQIYSIREHISYEKLLEESKLEMEQENKISQVIPIILFGIGVVYGNIQQFTKKKDLLKKVAPYLIFSLLFGTIIPNILSYLIFDHDNIHRLLICADIDFITISISFGLLITTLFLPIAILY